MLILVSKLAAKRGHEPYSQTCGARVQGASVMFTAELLLPSGNRIELIGYEQTFIRLSPDHCAAANACVLAVARTGFYLLTRNAPGCSRRLMFKSMMHRSDASGSPLVRIAPGVQAGELSAWTDENAVQLVRCWGSTH